MNTRVPLVTGISPGVGTSTLAAALHAEDGGLLGQQADVVVCGSATESLRAAARVICPGRGPRPVLAVVGPRVAVPPPVLHTLFGAIVEIPLVRRWDGRDTPLGEAAEVLAQSPDLLDPPLRPYSTALRAVVAALVGSGQLAASGPPMVIRPRPAEPVRRQPAAPPGRHRRRPEIRIVDQDDDTIEATTLAAERRLAG